MSRRVLFLPGAGADPLFWKPVGDLLPAEWQKHYFGWPGIGHQPPDSKVNSFGDLVRMVEEKLGDTPVDLLAQSMGGAVALRVALNNPGKIRRLVLTVTAGGIDVSRLGASDWRPEYRQEYPNAAPWILEARPNYESELKNISQPTLLLWGANDPISPVKVGEHLHSLLANSTLHVVPQGDHAIVNERPGDVIDLIKRHLD